MKPIFKAKRSLLSDEKLIEYINLSDDERALKELFNRYKKIVYYLVLKKSRNCQVSHEITNEAFARAFMKLKTYKKEYAFSTWIITIANNILIDFFRRKSNIPPTMSMDKAFNDEQSGLLNLDLRSTTPSVEERMIISETRTALQKCIQKLNPQYKEVIQLRYYEEYSFQQIAEHTNRPLGTVKVQARRAKERLRYLMKVA